MHALQPRNKLKRFPQQMVSNYAELDNESELRDDAVRVRLVPLARSTPSTSSALNRTCCPTSSADGLEAASSNSMDSVNSA